MSTQPQVLQDTPSKMKPLSSLRFFDPQTGQFVIRPKPFGDAEQVARANPGWRVSFEYLASPCGRSMVEPWLVSCASQQSGHWPLGSVAALPHPHFAKQVVAGRRLIRLSVWLVVFRIDYFGFTSPRLNSWRCQFRYRGSRHESAVAQLLC
jgi:hypothetical protein